MQLGVKLSCGTVTKTHVQLPVTQKTNTQGTGVEQKEI